MAPRLNFITVVTERGATTLRPDAHGEWSFRMGDGTSGTTTTGEVLRQLGELVRAQDPAVMWLRREAEMDLDSLGPLPSRTWPG